MKFFTLIILTDFIEKNRSVDCNTRVFVINRARHFSEVMTVFNINVQTSDICAGLIKIFFVYVKYCYKSCCSTN